MHARLHEQPLTTDQVTSIKIDKNISPREWELIKRAVGLGLLFPNHNANNPDDLPVKEGTFHLAYILAPHFRLLPRRGKSRSLSNITLKAPATVQSETVPGDRQQMLFADNSNENG